MAMRLKLTDTSQKTRALLAHSDRLVGRQAYSLVGSVYDDFDSQLFKSQSLPALPS